jgi:hypothetical protein
MSELSLHHVAAEDVCYACAAHLHRVAVRVASGIDGAGLADQPGRQQSCRSAQRSSRDPGRRPPTPEPMVMRVSSQVVVPKLVSAWECELQRAVPL